VVSTGPTHRAEAHQSGTCTCPKTSHTSVAAADLGHNRRHCSARRATTRDPGTRKKSPPEPPRRTVPLTHGSACATAGTQRNPEPITEATATTTALITD
jgi:hypothetical protein